jgi:hypothetical protein
MSLERIAPPAELRMDIRAPWLKGFEVGQGINALTGVPCPSPFKQVNMSQSNPSLVVTSHSGVIKGFQSLKDSHELGASATINLGAPAALGADFRYLKSHTVSSSSLMMHYTLEGKYDAERFDHQLELTAKAQKLLDERPDDFRDHYGDYFVAGFERVFKFQAILNCRCVPAFWICDNC